MMLFCDWVAFAGGTSLSLQKHFCSELLFFLDSLHLEPSRMSWKDQGIYLFWFLRPTRGFAKPRITNPQRAWDDCILNKPPGPIRVIYYAVELVRIMRK